MCLVFVLVKQLPNIPTLILFNRDEDFERPTAPAHLWGEAPGQILAGKDLVRGGTWGGVTTNGRIAFLTNVSEPHPAASSPRSRGVLVTDFLTGSETAEEFLLKLQADEDHYYGFNLVVGSSFALFHYSNRSKVITRLDEGIHGISNADLNTPWPKVVRGKEKLQQLVAEGKLNAASAFEVMRDTTVADEDKLAPGALHSEGARDRGTVFVRMADWGTRLTTVIALTDDGKVAFHEKGFLQDTTVTSYRSFELQWK